MEEKKQWEVYIIESTNGKLYTGITTDVERRFNEHCNVNDLGRGAKFFRTSLPQKIIYREICENRSMATKREIQIKRMSRIAKLSLAGCQPVA